MLSGCRPFGFGAIYPDTFKFSCFLFFFLAGSRPLAVRHISTLGNFEDPCFCFKLSVCEDSDVEWMPSICILGRVSLHFADCFPLAWSRPLAAGHILTLGNFKDPDFCRTLSVCQDSEVEWIPLAWILGCTSLHFQVLLFWRCHRL